ncbi:hypothetical protein GGC63_003285 [Paenibacillus sp. OAS669]|nr:hypothetical protein [Paenibacillus sp. OAS669]
MIVSLGFMHLPHKIDEIIGAFMVGITRTVMRRRRFSPIDPLS